MILGEWMSYPTYTVELENTYEVSGTFTDKEGQTVTPDVGTVFFEIYTTDYSTRITSTPMESGLLGSWLAYIDTGTIGVGKFIWRIEGYVNGKKVGDNVYVKVMRVEPE